MFNQHLQCKAMLQMIKQELVFIKVNVKLLRSASSLGGDLQSMVWEGA